MSSLALPLEAGTAQTTAAAKLHVLNLDPIKQRLGEKWPKLSDLVHKLFEAALRDAQSGRDHFVQVDELSYVVTFHGLSFEEATIACTSVAQKVCEKLFGGTDTSVVVRALVGQLAEDVLAQHFRDGKHIAAHLELNGREIMVKSDPSRIPPRVTQVTPGADDIDWAPVDTIRKARASVLPLGLEIGLFPIWELGRGKSSCLYAAPYSRGGTPKVGCTRQLLSSLPAKIVDAEITVLMTAHAYSHRLRQSGKVCALGAAVSFETLMSFHNRIRYITALKSLTIPAECPILLKIEDVPDGTPLGKVAEIIAMLAVPNVRFTVQYRSAQSAPKVDIRLGAAGMGIALPHRCDVALAAIFMKKLVNAFAEQRGFIFVEGLDTPELLAAAQGCGVRFGTGQALSRLWFSGEDQLPHFPLSPS
jgi:hypothetical protein